jgi:hypothetical protein
MPGGEIELTYVGAQDLYLISNPQLSFFKSIYKRYTNFSKEIKEIDDDSSNNNLSSFDNDIILKYKIPRNGDAIKNFYLEFDLPNIYSNDSKRFQWIKNLGEFIIKNISLTGDNSQEYSRITGEYLHIYNNYNHSKGQKVLLDKLIGNTKDMYDPSNTNNSLGLYPSSSKPSESDTQIQIPSIHGRKIIIPIPFWFSQHLGNVLPLIALQKVELKIEITLRPLKEWYTVIDTYPLSDTFRTRIRPIRDEDKLSNFTTNASNDVLETTVVSAYGEFIFLDSEERKRFAQNEHTYLINQVQYYSNSVSLPSGGNLNINLKDINHPVKRLWYFARRIDNEDVNDWCNFTFFNEDGLNPLSRNVISDSHHNYNLEYDNNDVSRINFLTDDYDGDIIRNTQLIFNGEPRFDIISSQYFSGMDFITTPNIIHDNLKGIYNISFCAKDKGEYQPSGSCNFSRISKKELRLTFKNPSQLTKTTGDTSKNIGNYRIFIIAENINFFKIIGGLAGLEFSN